MPSARTSSSTCISSGMYKAMMLLTDRQRQAEAMRQQLNNIGCNVINIMPLSPHRHLQFQVLGDEREAMLQRLASWGWLPTLITSGPCFCLDGTARAAFTYELKVEADRQEIPRDDIKQDDVVSKEIKEFRKLHGLR